MINNNKGFSLVEVIVAMVIFAAVMLTGWSMYMTAFKTNFVTEQRSRAYAIATYYIEQNSEEIIEGEGGSPRIIDEGEFKVTYEKNIPEIKVTVTHKKSGENVTLTTQKDDRIEEVDEDETETNPSDEVLE